MITNHVRIERPSEKDKYYINQSYGGISLNIVKDKKTGYTLPNCVALANAEFSREMNRYTHVEEMCRYFIFDAENFWWQCTNPKGHYYGVYKVGQTAKEGAIMVWSGGLGHVAICDYVGDTLEYVESTASGIYYNIQKFKDVGRRGMSSAYTFLGYIYNPYIYDIKPVEPVKRTLEKQIEVISNTLRVREDVSLKARIYGFCNKGIFNVYEEKEADGYKWAKIGEVESKSQWVAIVSGAVNELKCIGLKVRIKEGAPIRTSYKAWAYNEVFTIINKVNDSMVFIRSTYEREPIVIKKEYLYKVE